MALLPILSYPDPRLRTIAKPVKEVNDEIKTLIADMIETMYDAQGIGRHSSRSAYSAYCHGLIRRQK